MQAPRVAFSIPGFGWLRAARRPASSDPASAGGAAGRRGRWRGGRGRFAGRRWWPALGARALAGLVACLLVLAPGIIAAELLVWGYEARLTEDAHVRALAGLDAVAGLVDAERTRALNNADVAGSRVGLAASQGASSDELVKRSGDLRTGLRTSLVAVLDGSGRALASDPASNLPFGATYEAKQAFQGKPAVVIQERTPGFAVQAAAPLRVNGEIAPGAAIVAQNLDDPFLNAASRMNGLEVALIQNGRLVAASRGIRRSFAFATDQTLDADLIASGPDRFKRVRLGSEAFFLAGRVLTNGPREIGTVLVGPSADQAAEAVRWARTLAYGAVLVGALLAALLGARAGGWHERRIRRLAAQVRAISPLTTAASAAESTRLWAPLDAAIADATSAVRRGGAEQQLRAARLEAVLGSLAEGIIVADEQRHVIFTNRVARQLLQLPAGGSDRTGGGLERAGVDASTGAGERAEDGASRTRDGGQRVIRSYSAAVQGEGGQALGFVTVLRDATQEQEVERARSELLGVVSHELQTPLTAIKGALELVQEEDEGRLSRVQRRFLDTIDRNCARMIGLVGDLLDLSRLDAGRLELDSRPLDTPSVVAGSVAALANLFERRRQSVHLDVPPPTPPILGDRRRVEQILTNLLSNAAKYTPEGGRIEVSARAENGHVEIVVADSGPGIPESERELVFGRFYRGTDASRRGEAGSGLGLAIVRSLTELHGGRVRVADPVVSSSGSAVRGARFVVELPAAPEDAE
ncbi:MAG: PAS domain-containing sensor histidine kinase [Chloroflexota bacterium]